MMHFLLTSNLALLSLADLAYKTNGNTKMSELSLFVSNSYKVLFEGSDYEYNTQVHSFGHWLENILSSLSWHVGHCPYDHDLFK